MSERDGFIQPCEGTSLVDPWGEASGLDPWDVTSGAAWDRSIDG